MVITLLSNGHSAVGTKHRQSAQSTGSRHKGHSAFKHKKIYQQLKSYTSNLWLKPVNLNHQTASTRVLDSSRNTTLYSTSFLIAGRLVIARSAYCCLCLIVSKCSCFICPNGMLFSTVGKVSQKQEAAFLWRSLAWLCFCTTWVYVKLPCFWCKVLYHGEVSCFAACYSLDIHTCLYMYTYRIEMCHTVNCVHE